MKTLKHYLPEGWGYGSKRSEDGPDDPQSIEWLKELPQPITVNGGSYSYRADVTKTPIQWIASDGSVLDGANTIRSISRWMDNPEDFLAYLDGDYYIEDMIQDRVIRPGKGGVPAVRDQQDHEHKELMGDSIDPSLTENAEELNIGDDVIITGPVEFNGETGVISDFGSGKSFVVVNLYNHGKQSFHSSDVSFNDYAGSDEEAADMYDRDSDARNWGEHDLDESPESDHLEKEMFDRHDYNTRNFGSNAWVPMDKPKNKTQRLAQKKAAADSLDESADSLAEIRRLSGLK